MTIQTNFSNVGALLERGLPLLHTESDVSIAMDLEVPKLIWLTDRKCFSDRNKISRHYLTKTIPKSNGKKRVLLIPKARLMKVQYWILKNILKKVSPHSSAQGFRSGHSILTNAKPHVGKNMVICCDLKDFFPSISQARVRGMFQELGYSFQVANIFSRLCTTHLVGSTRRVLPQGAPTSPAISNLVARKLDCRLSGLSKKLGFEYSRYADDCTFSGNKNLAEALLKNFRLITKDEDFQVNEEKVRIRRKGACQKVTGIVVNKGLSVPREERRKLRALLHNAKTSGLEAQNRTKTPNFSSHIRGRVEFIKMVNPWQARSLLRAISYLPTNKGS